MALLIRFRKHLLLGIVCFGLFYLTAPRFYAPGDPIAVREETRAILESGSLSVPAGLGARFGEPGQYFFRNPANGLFRSKYGLMGSILFLPPLAMEKWVTGELPPHNSPSRVFFLNQWNSVVFCVIFALLLSIAGLFTSSFLSQGLFAVSCCFATFMWNYLRAANTEIFQIALMLGFFFSVVKWRSIRNPEQNRFLNEGLIWFQILCLTLIKISFLLLIPIWLGFKFMSAPTLAQSQKRFIRDACAVLSVIGVVLWVNFVKFGAFLETGYGQWRPEYHSFFHGDWFQGMYGFLFTVPKSIFLHFPPLILAGFGFHAFFKRFRAEALLVAALFLTFLGTIAALPNWHGEASYGPRLLVPFLPIAAVPSILFIETSLQSIGNIFSKFALGLYGVALVLSVFLQIQVNSTRFLGIEMFRDFVCSKYTSAYPEYFEKYHAGQVAREARSLISGNEAGAGNFRELLGRMPPELRDAVLGQVWRNFEHRNYYWFRGEE